MLMAHGTETEAMISLFFSSHLHFFPFLSFFSSTSHTSLRLDPIINHLQMLFYVQQKASGSGFFLAFSPSLLINVCGMHVNFIGFNLTCPSPFSPQLKLKN